MVVNWNVSLQLLKLTEKHIKKLINWFNPNLRSCQKKLVEAWSQTGWIWLALVVTGSYNHSLEFLNLYNLLICNSGIRVNNLYIALDVLFIFTIIGLTKSLSLRDVLIMELSWQTTVHLIPATYSGYPKFIYDLLFTPC